MKDNPAILVPLRKRFEDLCRERRLKSKMPLNDDEAFIEELDCIIYAVLTLLEDVEERIGDLEDARAESMGTPVGQA